MDPVEKRIFAVGLGTQGDERRVVLLLEAEQALVSKRTGLSEQEAELFAQGVLEGLRVAALGYTFEEAPGEAARSGTDDWQLLRQPLH